MKRLFIGEYETYSPDAIAIARKITRAIKEILSPYIADGYPIREMSSIAYGCVTDVEATSAIEKCLKNCKKRER